MAACIPESGRRICRSISFVSRLAAIWGSVFFFFIPMNHDGVRGEDEVKDCIVITNWLAVWACRTGQCPVDLVEGMWTSGDVKLAQCCCVHLKY